MSRRVFDLPRPERLALRVEMDGRLIAAHLPAEMHGDAHTYVNHGCQCDRCRADHALAQKDRWERRRMRASVQRHRQRRDTL